MRHQTGRSTLNNFKRSNATRASGDLGQGDLIIGHVRKGPLPCMQRYESWPEPLSEGDLRFSPKKRLAADQPRDSPSRRQGILEIDPWHATKPSTSAYPSFGYIDQFGVAYATPNWSRRLRQFQALRCDPGRRAILTHAFIVGHVHKNPWPRS